MIPWFKTAADFATIVNDIDFDEDTFAEAFEKLNYFRNIALELIEFEPNNTASEGTAVKAKFCEFIEYLRNFVLIPLFKGQS